MRRQQRIQALDIMIKRSNAVSGGEKRCDHGASNAACGASDQDNARHYFSHGIPSG
jgi:hypothetical protein